MLRPHRTVGTPSQHRSYRVPAVVDPTVFGKKGGLWVQVTLCRGGLHVRTVGMKEPIFTPAWKAPLHVRTAGMKEYRVCFGGTDHLREQEEALGYSVAQHRDVAVKSSPIRKTDCQQPAAVS